MTEKTAAQLQQYLKTRVAIDPETGCWNWQKATTKSGYGQCRLGARTEYTHRLAHAVFKGPIPHGLHIDHLCRNRRCCNPDHLEAVEQRVNNRRALGIADNGRSGCRHGHGVNARYYDKRGQLRCKDCDREGWRRERERRRTLARTLKLASEPVLPGLFDGAGA